MKKIIKCILILFLLPNIIFLSCNDSFQEEELVKAIPKEFPFKYGDKPLLIAHAGGEIDGNYYTNSREAVDNSINKGYKFIELDLILLDDSVIGAAHDINYFNMITGWEEGTPILSYDFKNRKIFNLYSPLLADDIFSIFKNLDAYLVTDKISNIEKLSKQIPLYKDKMLIETFSYSSYKGFLERGYSYPMLCVWSGKQLEDYWSLLISKKVRIITIPVDLIENCEDKLNFLLKNGITIFAFTSNDKDFILKYGGKIVTGFYTDNITNKDL